jgi:DNA-binding transcriptional MerR regulator
MEHDNRDERCYGIEELAELGGVTRRTVRYYVQRGLLPTPLGTGRGPHYTPTHLQRLIHIRKLQETGVPLVEIVARLDGALQTPVSVPEVLPEPERSTWMRFVLADGVELHVRTGAARVQPSQLARLVEATRHTLGLQAVPHPSERSNTHERNAAQLSGDIAPGPDPTPGRTH